jgi:hypothetical protein
MSTPIGMIIQDIAKAQRLQTLDFKKDISVSIRLAADELSRMTDWAGLRSTMTAVFDGTTPIQLPSHMAGIVCVMDIDGVVVPQKEVYGEKDYGESFYAFTNTELAPLVYAKGFDIEEGADRFTLSGGLVIDPEIAVDGEFIQFGAEPGFYKITIDESDNYTIYPRYFGPKITDGWAVIRPQDTKQITFGTAGTYTITYWRFEEALYLEHQRTVLPPGPLGLLTIIHILGFHEKQESVADNYRRSYETGLSWAMAQNPRYLSNPPKSSEKSSGGVSFRRSR